MAALYQPKSSKEKSSVWDLFSLQDPTPVLFTIQEHDAERAGKHFDIRIVPEGSKIAYSFAARKDPVSGEINRLYLIPQPDHEASYATWQGVIREGYGKGKVKLHFVKSGYLMPEEDKVKIVLDDHTELNLIPYKDGFLLVKSDFWKRIPRSTVLERAPFKETFSMPEEKRLELIKHPETIATEKIDGANVFVHFTEKGPIIVSRRLSVTGDPIVKTPLLPQFMNLKVPKELIGLVVNAELYHDKGFNHLSGILNSNPSRAVKTQLETGPVKMAIFDLPTEKTLKYKEKLEKIKELVKKINHPLITHPRIAEREKDKLKLYEEAHEGVVVGFADKTVNEAPLYKIKKRRDFDLVVVDYVPGQGRFKGNGIGALILADASGRIVGKVGSGFTDEQRRWILKNWDKVKGSLVKVEAMVHPHRGTLRAPVFLGFTTDKNVPDYVSISQEDRRGA